jgi:hypothetical protein
MTSIHEQIADGLVALLNADDDWETGPILVNGTAQKQWQPYRDKSELSVLTVEVIPRAELRELQSRCSTEKMSAVDIGVRQGCSPTDETLIGNLDTLVDDIKNYVELKPIAGRAFQAMENEPIYPRAFIEETGVYQSVVTVTYRFGDGD